MGMHKATTWEISVALDHALDNVGDFTEKQLLDALDRARLYPFVSDKPKSAPEYVKAGSKLEGFE